MITQDRLKEVLHYDPETGAWTWLVCLSSRALKGSRAGCMTGQGYRHIRVDRRLYLAHRLAVLYMTGGWPTETVDGPQEWDSWR